MNNTGYNYCYECGAQSKKFAGRWYRRVALDTVAPGDVVSFVVDPGGFRTQRVISVSAKRLVVAETGKNRSIARASLTEVWRRGATPT